MNHRKFLIPLLIFPVFALLMLTSCVSTQTIEFDSGFSGNAEYKANVKDYFITVLDDFTSLSDTTGEEQLFRSMENFNHNLVVSPYADNEKKSKVANSYRGTFDFSDFGKLFDDLCEGKPQTIMHLYIEGDTATLHFHIDKDNYEELDSLVAFITDETLSGYGPKYNQDMTAEEYEEMIDFVMGDGGSAAIESSRILITIITPDGEKHNFPIPLIDFLLLHDPIDIAVHWPIR